MTNTKSTDARTLTRVDGSTFTIVTPAGLATELTAQTGMTWTVGVVDHTATGGAFTVVQGDDGSDGSAPTVVVRVTNPYTTGDHARLELSGTSPDGVREVYVPDSESCHLHITLAAHTAAPRVARAIVTRLLPDYLPRHAVVAARVTEHRAGVAAAVETAARLAAAAGPGASIGSKESSVYLPHGSAAGYGSADVWHGGERVDLDLVNLPTAVALAVLAVLADARTA